jgi:hypothetical protein
VKARNMANYANYYYYAAAAATAIAGILHIILSSNTIGRNPMRGIFFLVGGIAQLFCIFLGAMIRSYANNCYSTL